MDQAAQIEKVAIFSMQYSKERFAENKLDLAITFATKEQAFGFTIKHGALFDGGSHIRISDEDPNVVIIDWREIELKGAIVCFDKKINISLFSQDFPGLQTENRMAAMFKMPEGPVPHADFSQELKAGRGKFPVVF